MAWFRFYRMRHPHLLKVLVLFLVLGILIFGYILWGKKASSKSENSNKSKYKIVAVQPPPTPKSPLPPPPPAPPPPKPEPPPPPPKSYTSSTSRIFNLRNKSGLIAAYEVLVVPGDWYNTRIKFGSINWFLFNYTDDTSGHLEMLVGDQNWSFDLPLGEQAYYEFGGSRVSAQSGGTLKPENESKYVMFRATENAVRLHCEVYIQH
jgi:hypothetical protein